MKTTLNNIRKHLPCSNGWTKLLKSLNKTTGDDEPLELSYILESNGLDDVIWCLRAVEGIDKECRLYAVFCARQVQHLNDDPRVSNAIDVAERFANGEATVEELLAARSAAYNAAYAAARSAVHAAARSAVHAAAYNAAYAAARSAVHAAAYNAAYAAAYAAARSAVHAAAYAAAYAAACSADVREAQKQKFIEMFC
jgi:hypothetical protein